VTPDDRRLPQARGILPIAAGFLLLAGIVLLTAWYVGKQQANTQAVQRTLEVQEKLTKVLSLVQDAETGQRGYLLSGVDAYLEPYQSALDAYDGCFEDLGTAIADNPRQQQTFNSLRAASDEKLVLLRSAIERFRAGDQAEVRGNVLSAQGKEVMDRFRAIVARMKGEEAALLAQRRSAADRAAVVLQVGILSSIVLVLILAAFVLFDARRRFTGVAAARDELATANRGLVEAAARYERLESQLRQSQKMEAIGQLTGGLAHDFNNMLAIVIGSLNLLKRRAGRGEFGDTDKYVNNALDGAERAATLTNRLLAFARQQPLSPEPTDPNKFVAGMSDLLRRTLGDDVQLETVLAGGLWRTHADASQLENALLNLSINARDAMPEGGKLTIETLNAHLDEAYAADHVGVPAGQYVLIAVTDTGTGMPKEVIEKAFDPFFTTKGTGKGTGLGLSQVFGFVKQTGGHIKIYSEPGHGTTIKLYLPRFLGAGDERGVPQKPVRETASGSPSELILVVEDEERMRQVAVESLRELGYSVLEADGAASGLRILDAEPGVALLFTDIVMPDVNGRKLADEAVRRRPELKVLFTTGYTRNAVVHNGLLDRGVHLIGKPFTLEQLAAKVREALGTPPRPT
jgi:signal transduction histidine kinase/ActR/RegA family two-component response regulator